MGLRKTPAEKAAIADMKAADRALNDLSDREVSSEYLRLNAAANEAAAKVSFWHGGTKRG
jgi:hypothetical protein